MGTYGGTISLCDLTIELDVGENTGIGPSVNILNFATDGLGNQSRKTLDVIFRAIYGSYIHKGCDRLLGRRHFTDGMQSTRKQARFDLHDSAVYLANNAVTFIYVEIFCVLFRPW